QLDEQRDGIAMQQAFSGEVGVDAGGLQLAGRGSELAVQARVDGVYADFPFPTLAVGTGDPRAAATGRPAVLHRDQVWTHGTGLLRGQVTGRRITIWRSPALDRAAPVWIEAAPGIGWTIADQSTSTMTIDQVVGARRIRFTLRSSTAGGRLTFVAAGTDGNPAIRWTAPSGGASPALIIDAAGVADTTRILPYRRQAIFDRYRVTSVVLFRSSGTLADFPAACFPRTARTPLLVIVHRNPSCG
ncbi:MAG TPA: hypothetical protein VGM93_01710, partial [Acidimicrobiales bacterium]